MESLLVEEEVLSRKTQITAEKGHNFWSDCWISLQYLQLFLEALFLLLPIESLLGEEEVLSRQTGITAEKRHNFWSECWIALIYLQ
jgi:hypothetical protein